MAIFTDQINEAVDDYCEIYILFKLYKLITLTYKSGIIVPITMSSRCA